MNKKLIALAVASAFAVPAAANAAPTLYGHMQAEISSEDATGPTTNITDGRIVQGGGGRFQNDVGVDDNKRGRLGVKGSHDLGGGLKGIYKMEWQIESTEADIDDGDRESFVGLKGGFGQVELGRIKSAYKYWGGVKYDPFVTTEIEARRYGGMTTGNFGSNGFLDRTLGYQGKFGLVKLRFTYGLSEQDDDNGDYTLGLGFGNKMWEAGFALAHDENDTSTADDSYDAAKLFGKVKIGKNMQIRGQYEVTEDEDGTADNGNLKQEGEIIFVGFDMKFGKNNISIQAAQGTVEVAGAPDQENDYLAIGYTHKFSKKARIFAGYGDMSVDNANNVAANNGERDAVTVGMRIDF